MNPKPFLAGMLALAFAGCTTGEIKLDERWRPLKRIAENSAWPSGVATTIGDTVYTRSLRQLRRSYDTPTEWEAFLIHEHTHAVRAKRDALYVFRYGVDPDFMWAEERQGWGRGILFLRARGRLVSVDATVAALIKYQTAVGGEPMVGAAEARAWVLDVLAGRWQPED